MPDEKVIIAYCFDRNYAPFAAVSTYSAIKNSTSKFRIYWCTGETDVEYAKELARTLAEKISCEPIVVTLKSEHISNWRTGHGLQLAEYYSPAMFFRLLLPDALPENRIVYIDCDTIVQSDLAELFSLDMQGLNIAAVPHRWTSLVNRMPLAEGEPIVNSGVMLLDLAGLREDNFLEKCEVIYKTYNQELTFVDQCIINKYAEGKKLVLPGKWNRVTMAGSRIASHFDGVEEAGIVHFVSPIKPWHAKSDSKMSALWWSYARELGMARGPVPVPVP